MFFLYCSFPRQGLALGTEAPPQPAPLAPTIAHYTPEMTGAEAGACPARHLPPLLSRKATVQVPLFLPLLLKAIF